MLKIDQLRKLSRNLTAEPDNYMHSFRKNMFMYIDQKGITLADIAEAADIPFNTLRTFLYGESKDCHLSSAIKLARVLGVSVDELVGCGTISPQTCESLQLTRMLPESFTHFVRWAIHYHYDALTRKKVTNKAIEIMQAGIAEGGNMLMNNNFVVEDISDLSDCIRPKVFMGIRVPCDSFAPHFFTGDTLLIAGDRQARTGENVIISVSGNMWVLKRKDEHENGVLKIRYYSLIDGRVWQDDPAQFVLGYVAKVVQDM